MDSLTITDATLDTLLTPGKAVLLLLTTGEGLRGDFATAFRKAAAEQKDVTFARLDPTQNPQAAARFDAGSKPVLLGLVGGEEIVRRGKPWGHDVTMVLEAVQAVISTQNPIALSAPPEEETVQVIDNVPVHVTDATFQQAVLDHDKPVLVDFWAAWCGPCRQVAPVLDKLAGEFAGQIRIAKVDVDANPGLSQAFKIMSIPTIMLIKNRTVVFSQPGALPESAFRDLIKQLIALEVPDPEPQQIQE